jgi:hypothetical protein
MAILGNSDQSPSRLASGTGNLDLGRCKTLLNSCARIRLAGQATGKAGSGQCSITDAEFTDIGAI